MAVAIELGDPDDIHPPRKREVAQRLSFWALSQVYGKAIPFSGPLPAWQEIKGDQIICKFRYAEGGSKTRDGGEVKGFMVAESPSQWVLGVARIVGDQVVVSSPRVKSQSPCAMRGR